MDKMFIFADANLFLAFLYKLKYVAFKISGSGESDSRVFCRNNSQTTYTYITQNNIQGVPKTLGYGIFQVLTDILERIKHEAF